MDPSLDTVIRSSGQNPSVSPSPSVPPPSSSELSREFTSTALKVAACSALVFSPYVPKWAGKLVGFSTVAAATSLLIDKKII